MPDRLAELRRQRALIADHLAWIDREIAGATAVPGLVPPASPPVPVSIVSTSAPASGGTPPGMPDPARAPTVAVPVPPAPRLTMVGGHRVVGEAPLPTPLPTTSPANIKDDVRRGCFLYVALAALLVVVGGALLVWASQAYKAKHPPVPRVENSDSR